MLLLAGLYSRCFAQPPYFDAHIHFNWDQKEVISAEQIVKKLKKANAAFAVVSSTPSALALELKQAGGELVIPFFSPYTHELGKYDWHLSERTVQLAKEGLENNHYRGIGEVHFMTGFSPKTDNSVFEALLTLARTYAVPVLIHIDSGNERAFLNVCLNNPEIQFLFAHAGGNLYPKHIRSVLRECNNAMIEFSARDPWRYGGLTSTDQTLLSGWRDLVLEYPDRFMIGTDPVWRVTRTQSWDLPDDGWDHYEKLLDYHLNWIDALPESVQQKLRLDNAKRFFNIQ